MKTIMKWAGGAALGLMMSVVYGVKNCTWEKVMKVVDHKVLYSDCYLQYIAMKNGVPDIKVKTEYQKLSTKVYKAVIKISGYENWSCYKSTDFNNNDFPNGQLIGNCSKKIINYCRNRIKTDNHCAVIYEKIPLLGQFNGSAYEKGYENCIKGCRLMGCNCGSEDLKKTLAEIRNPANNDPNDEDRT